MSLVEPHGGTLIDRFARGAEEAEVRAAAGDLPRIVLDAREQADLELIATGAASPLNGFLGPRDYHSVLHRLRLANGIVWPLPLTLAVAEETRETLRVGRDAALLDAGGHLLGVIRVEHGYLRDPEEEARQVYGTVDPSHPGVAYLLGRPRTLISGPVRALPLRDDLPFARYRLTPRALRAEIAARGWRRVAGFQTRNPIHRAHEHLTKLALEVTDGLVLHPLVGETKGDDVPAAVRFRAYEVLVERYYPRERTLLAAFPAAMRYAGPREALFHALVRKNYGITHLLVGRDHAGFGRYHGPFEAHAIFDRFSFDEVGVAPLRLDASFFCRTCGALASPRTCPHGPEARLELSGTRVREMLRAGQPLPPEFTRPEVAEVLREHYAREAPAPLPPPSAGAPERAPLLPLFLKLQGRRVVLVGGGPVAAARAEPLRAAGASLVVVAPEVRPELDLSGVQLERRPFRPADLDGAWLAVAAATPEVNRQVHAAAETRGVFVNATDDPDAASAYAPAVLTRGGVTVAVSSHGEAPALAGLLREALEAVLPWDLERWLEKARAERRQWKQDGVPMTQRRPLLLEALNRLYPEASA